MSHFSSKTFAWPAIAGFAAALSLAATAQAQGLPPVPLAPPPSYERSPQTAELNLRMLEQIERNPGATMATRPITVIPAPTVTYPPPAPYPPLMPQPQR